MASVYKLILMAIMTSEFTLGYKRAFGFQHRIKGRRLPGGKPRSFDPAYDFFKTSVVKKPIITTEIHVLPEIYIIKGDNPPPKFQPTIKLPPKKGDLLHKIENGLNLENIAVHEERTMELKRPLVHLFNKQNSEIGKAIDKYFSSMTPDGKKPINGKISKIGDIIDKALSADKKREIPVDAPKLSPDIGMTDIQYDNQVPPLKESFPVPATKVLDMHAVGPSGPGPYRNCFPPSLVICGSRLPWAHVVGMKDWCEQNCDKEAYKKHCDDIRCTCKCLAPGEAF